MTAISFIAGFFIGNLLGTFCMAFIIGATKGQKEAEARADHNESEG